jgi:hypothetical protein
MQLAYVCNVSERQIQASSFYWRQIILAADSRVPNGARLFSFVLSTPVCNASVKRDSFNCELRTLQK